MNEIPLSQLPEHVDEVLNILENGGVILYPTDTVAGLGTLANSFKGLQRIQAIKARPSEKPVSYIFRDEGMVEKYCILDRKARLLIHHFLPGALTVVLPVREDREIFGMNRQNRSVGVRMIEITGLDKLVKNLPQPLATTSANLSGERTHNTYGEIPRSILHAVDIAISWNCRLATRASTVIDLTGSDIKILRKGSIKSSEIFTVLKS